MVLGVAIALVAHQPALLAQGFAQALAAAIAPPATTSDLGAMITRWLKSYGALGSFLMVVVGFLLLVLFSAVKSDAIKGGLRPISKESISPFSPNEPHQPINPQPEGRERYLAYRALIEKLLYCPSGFENSILKRHRELIDEGLVFQIGYYSMDLRSHGLTDVAEFLVNLHDQIAAFIRQNNSPQERPDPSMGMMKHMQSCSDERLDENMKLIKQLMVSHDEKEFGRMYAARREPLDLGFVRLCYQTAQMLEEQNKPQAAAWWRSFAAKLVNVIPIPKPKPAVDLDLRLSI